MSGQNINILADVKYDSDFEDDPKFIDKCLVISILLDKIFYPSKIVDCRNPIYIGQSGRVTISILPLSGYGLKIEHGDQFSIWAGPGHRVATGQVVGFI
jgi:hypothetical protein